MMKRLLLAFCVLFGTQVLSAQIISSRNVTTRNVTVSAKKVGLQKGYRGFIEFLPGINFDSDNIFAFDVTTTHGYQCTHWLFVGVGAGITGTFEEEKSLNDLYLSSSGDYRYTTEDEETCMAFSIPLYASARIYCNPSPIKFYIDVRIGGLIPLNSFYTVQEVEDFPYEVERKNGGFYGQFGVGMEIGHFSFGLNYCLRGYKLIDYSFKEEYKEYTFPSQISPGLINYNIAVNF